MAIAEKASAGLFVRPVARASDGADRIGGVEPCRRPERVDLVGLLPGEVGIVTAEVAVGGGLAVDRAAEVEVAQDRGRPEVEHLADELLDQRLVDVVRPEGLDVDRERVGDADRVGNLDLAALGEPGGDDVLGHVARGVGARAVDLGRILAREGAAAVRDGAAVGVDDDLAAGEPGVSHRPADHELAGRVDVEEVGVLQAALVVEICRAGSAGAHARSGPA